MICLDSNYKNTGQIKKEVMKRGKKMKFGKFNKKWGAYIVAVAAISGLAMTPLVSNASKAVLKPTTSSVASQKSSADSTLTSSKNTDKVKTSEFEDANGNMKRTGINSDADISMDMLRYQLGDTSVVEVKSTTQLLKYLANRNSTFKKPAIRITSVDNSKLKYFPKIDSQGELNNCTLWATAYYQMSYAVNKALNRDGKLDENVMSPTWVYNMINSGENCGSYYSDALLVLSEVGCVPITTVPIENKNYGDNLRTMHAYKNNWLEARNYRVREYYTIDLKNDRYDTVVNCNTDVDLDVIKKALATGEVLSATTYSSAWNRQTIQHNNYNKENDKYLGQTIISRCDYDGYGAHRVTIVGYDDDIWVDINENGCVEKGEKGAFKIANSWGSDFDNDGFIWMSYDALNLVSSVKNSDNVTLTNNTRKMGLFDVIGFTIDTDTSDSDCYAALELESDSAHQTRLVVSATDKDGNVVGTYKPVPFFNSPIIQTPGVYPYNGYGSDNKGEFYIDLSNVVKGVTKDTINDYNWYITVADAVFDASDIKVNNAKLYIVSEDRYIDTDWTEPVTIDYDYKTFKTINPEIPDNFTETEIYLESNDPDDFYGDAVGNNK